mmetsp:Transcript_111803/g.193830  ORF Transcript_111803/g.193830 Transcript_111803/m.193830 type:complete len:157 (-) Transcript_111803:74-544(-)
MSAYMTNAPMGTVPPGMATMPPGSFGPPTGTMASMNMGMPMDPKYQTAPPMMSGPPMGSMPPPMGSMPPAMGGPPPMASMGPGGPPPMMSGQYMQNVSRPQMTGVANPPIVANNIQYGPSYKMQYQKRSTSDKTAVKYTGFLPLEGVYEEDTCRIG